MNRPRLQAGIVTLTLASLLIATGGQKGWAEETAADKGRAIMARSDRSDQGFKDSTAKLEMILRSQEGAECRRTLLLKTLEIPDENLGNKSLVIFKSPPDVKGTALLSHARILAPDDQWLYLPALKRTKRISSVNKSGPFMSSEFAFEDFTALELNKYRYKFLRTETFDGMVCDVVEAYPLYEHSGYSRQVSWIDQDIFQVRKIDYYDRRGELLKTLTLKDYKAYNEKYWRALKLLMVNRQTGKSTDLIYSDYIFRSGLAEKDFVKSVLPRIR